jgi:hypothetical protein
MATVPPPTDSGRTAPCSMWRSPAKPSINA